MANVNLAGHERRILQVRALGLFVKMKEALKIDWAAYAEHQRLVELELRYQPRNDVGVRAFFDFQPHRNAFAALRHLGIDGLQQGAAFFLFEVQVAVAGNAECRRG